jgi:hypothetical protein
MKCCDIEKRDSKSVIQKRCWLLLFAGRELTLFIFQCLFN